MRRLLFNALKALTTFSLVACGKAEVGVQIYMDSSHEYMAKIAVEKLQVESKNPNLEFTDYNPYIVITAVSDDAVSKYGKGVLGVALVGNHPCRIEIAERTFQANQDWLNSVIWHEIGHCYYLRHTDSPYDIMYKYAKPLSAYSQQVLDSFFRRLYEKEN